MAAPPKLVSDSGAYRIDVDRDEIDLHQFRTLAGQARSMVRDGEHELAVHLVESALELWNGTPLADLHGERARHWRYWADTELLIPVHETLLQALSALGRFDEVIHRLADLPVEHRSNLTLIKLRLEALRGVHRANEAATYYLHTRKRLTADFDHEEADELKRFYDELVRHRSEQPAARPEPTVPAIQTPHLVPHDIVDFAGREILLRQLDAMATTTTGELVRGIVVLDGQPGVGKTSLAVHWAHRIADRFPEGQLFADLSGFANCPKVEPAEVIDAFLTAFGFAVERIPTTAARAAKLRGLLAGRRVLVILDNAHSSDHVAPLLDCLSTCLIVVTSRRLLTGVGRRGALRLTVPPLDYQEAKEWLAHRVGRRADDDPGAIAQLTAMCEGSPLALRGVAEHVVSRPLVRLGEFVDELRDAQVLLGLGDDGDGEDGSVRAVFSWSYHALPATEQQLFRLLGLHPGPDISLEAAAALAGRSRASTKRDLDVLVNAHLLTQPESRNRYRFHDLLRRYATECATDGSHRDEREAAEHRVLSFYLHTANNADRAAFPYKHGVEMLPVVDGVVSIDFSDVDDAMNWCIRERSNLSAIVRYAESRELHDYVLRLPSTAGEILQRAGYYDDLLGALTMAVRSARALGDVEGETYSLGNLGFVCLALRDFASAESYLRASDVRSQEIGYRLGSAVAKHHLAQLHVERGEFDQGVRLHLDALDMFRRLEAKGNEVIAVYRLGEAYRRANNLHAAMSSCRDGLWLAEQLGDLRGQALILTELGISYYEYGDLASARGYALSALAIHERLRDAAQAGKTYNVLCAIHRAEGDKAEAERCAYRAITYCRSARDFRGQAVAHDALGQLLHARAHLDEASEAWSKALAILEDLGDPLASSVRARLAELAELPPPIPATRTVPLLRDQQSTA